MNTSKRVMLLIDADNVSADVVEQAVDKVHREHGAIHVRRAYCTAESALANLKLFKAHSIRPIVNLSTGKNSTDIALAVDAVDLVISERPDVVVIVSSDSDFAPLVIKLREKGCRVEGIGQQGKTGDDSKPVYDDFTDIAHRKARATGSAGPATAPARKRSPAGSGGGARSPAGTRRRDEPAADVPIVAASAPVALTEPQAPPPTDSKPVPADSVTATPASPARAQPRAPRSRASSTRRQQTAPRIDAAPPPSLSTPSTPSTPARSAPAETQSPPSPAAAKTAAAPMPDDLRRILAVLPELVRGAAMDLGLAAERLRSEELLARNASSARLFRKYPDWFVLSPDRQPNKVQYRRAVTVSTA